MSWHLQYLGQRFGSERRLMHLQQTLPIEMQFSAISTLSLTTKNAFTKASVRAENGMRESENWFKREKQWCHKVF